MNQLYTRDELATDPPTAADREIAELTRQNASLCADLRDATEVVRGQREVVEAAAALVSAMDGRRHLLALEMPELIALKALREKLMRVPGVDDDSASDIAF